MNLKKKESTDVSARTLVIAIVSCCLLLMIACAAICVKCNNTVYATGGAQSGYMFERVCFGIGDDVIVYDKDTKVMYVRYRNSGSYTVLVNADGTPRLYEENE